MPILGVRSINLRSNRDAATNQFYKNIVDNGGSISNASLAAINIFVRTLRSIGIWELCSEICVYAGNNLNTALIKLKYPAGIQSPLTNVNFIASDYSEPTGLTGNGLNKYLRTGWIASQQLSTSVNAHLSIYSRNNMSTLLNFPSYAGASSGARFLIRRSPLSVIVPDRIDAYLGNGTENNTFMASSAGFICASNIQQNSGHLFLNGDNKNTNSNFSVNARPSVENYIFATNNNSNAVNISDANICFHSFGQGLSAVQVSQYYSAVQLLQTSLGRNI